LFEFVDYYEISVNWSRLSCFSWLYSRRFIYSCNVFAPPYVAGDIECYYCVQSLLAVNVSAVINFLPQLLSQLFHLLTRTSSEDVAMNAVR